MSLSLSSLLDPLQFSLIFQATWAFERCVFPAALQI